MHIAEDTAQHACRVVIIIIINLKPLRFFIVICYVCVFFFLSETQREFAAHCVFVLITCVGKNNSTPTQDTCFCVPTRLFFFIQARLIVIEH